MTTVEKQAGFTLVEVILAASLSIFVFGAMALVLTKSFSLWKEATAQWQLTQYARVSRERILCGVTNNADVQTGLLSASNAVVLADSGWDYITYNRKDETGVVYQVRGWSATGEDKHIQLRKGVDAWVYGQSIGSEEPKVKVDSFNASVSNDLVTIVYRLKSFVGGKTNTQWQTINAALVNKE